MCSEVTLSLLIVFAVAAALWLKETLLRHQCVYQTRCTISGWFGLLLMSLVLIFTSGCIGRFLNILWVGDKKTPPIESLSNCVNNLA